jgi:hypothetical protein
VAAVSRDYDSRITIAVMRSLWISLLFAAIVQGQDATLWGNLAPGPYPIGYRTSVALDTSRTYDNKARPILLAMWYPASEEALNTVSARYNAYLRVPDVPEHPMFKPRLEAFVRNVVSNAARLLDTPTAAHEDAQPARGRFPVVLYHPGAGGSFEENSLLFEYLASHGYIVVSSAFQSPFPDSMGNNVGGIERSVPDLLFLSREVARLPFADTTRLAAIGHSAGAQFLFEWIGSPLCPARAFVSLDTTLEYTAEKFKGHRGLRRALKRLTPPQIPVLVLAQARMRPRFRTFDYYLRRSRHTYVAVPHVQHDHFLTHGFAGRVLTGHPQASAVRRSYEEMCRTIKAFLDTSLSRLEPAWDTMRRVSICVSSSPSVFLQPAPSLSRPQMRTPLMSRNWCSAVTLPHPLVRNAALRRF